MKNVTLTQTCDSSSPIPLQRFGDTQWRSHVEKIGAVLIGLIVAASVGKAALELYSMLRFEVSGPIEGDSLIYLIMGKALLHGTEIYTDLYESKPPFIFLIFAVSQLLSGGTGFALLLDCIMLASVPVLFGIFAWNNSNVDRVVWERLLTVALGSITGALFVLRLQQVTGTLQAEVFGFFFTFLYIITAWWEKGDISRHRILLSGLFLLCAIGTKEPFILGALAAAIFFSYNLRQFLRHFLLPLAVAIGIGTVLLLITGLLHSYIFIHLPAMLFARTDSSNLWNLLRKASSISVLYSSITTGSTVALLGYFTALCWFNACCLKVKKRSRCLSYCFSFAVAWYVGVHSFYSGESISCR